jgi:hypothetical protein
MGLESEESQWGVVDGHFHPNPRPVSRALVHFQAR